MLTDKIGSGPACDTTKLFIEVTGIQHDPSYSFQFYGAKDDSRKKDIEGKKVCQPLGDTSIYSWEWKKNASPINACLSIAAENGDITLPLYDDAQAKERIDGEQDYLLHSIVPLTLLPTYNKHLQDNERYAPTRNGYLYVFYNNKVWRELEIHASDSEGVQFQDVDLSAYRTGENDTFSSDKREAVGNPLKDIWLPVKDNNKDTLVHLAYSDVPWSGERLNYLEANLSELKKRAQSLHELKGADNPPSNRTKEGCVLFASSLPEMRARADIEWHIAEPIKFNRDLTGSSLNQQYTDIKSGIEKANNNGDEQFEALMHRSAFQYEYGMKETALKSLITNDNDLDKNWEASQSLDYLGDAKARQLRTLVLDDPVFDLKQRAFIVLSGAAYMQQLYVDMSQQEYYQTAELTQQMIMTERFGQQDNALYKFNSDVSRDLSGRFHRTLRTRERLIANRDIKELQYYVDQTLNSQRTADVLRDISSLNGLNSAGAHKIVGHAMSALSINIDKIDAFSKYHYIYDHLPADRPLNQIKSLSVEDCHATLRSVLSSSSHPLCKVLFVEEGSVTLDSEYTPPEALNDGSGFATPESLAQWSQNDFELEDDQLEVIDLVFITKSNVPASLSDKVQDAFSQARRVSSILNSILSSYYEALMSIKDLASEAKVIQFNQAYASVLALTKATNPTYLGKMLFTSAQGAETKGYVVGVHGQGLEFGLSADDREHIKNKRRKGLQGQLREENGRLVVASNKKPFSNADKANLAERGNLKVVVLPEDSEMAQAYNQANTQRALRNMNNPEINSSNVYERIRIPYWIVAIETVNLVLNFKYFESFYKGKDRLPSFGYMVSASVDLSVAVTHAANLHGQNASLLTRAANKTMITLPQLRIGSAELVASLSRLAVAGLVGGLLTAGMAFWEALRLSAKNDDDASAAMYMVAVGTGMSTIATGLFTTSVPILFGMGPIAWLGIGIAVTGALLYMLFLDTPIEEWLKNGPFADDPGEQYAHLQDNKVAFERFVNCLFSVEIKAYQYDRQTGLPEGFNAAMQAKGVTHAIRVSSNLATLMGEDNASIDFYARPAMLEKIETRSRIGISHDEEVKPLGSKPLSIIAQTDGPDSTVYFVKHDTALPTSHSDSSLWGGKVHSYRYAKAFIARVRLHIGDEVFPMPALDQAAFEDPVFDPPHFMEDEKSWGNQAITITPNQKP
ncbi:toxin VasX [Marinomonas primoryensis]|uniref:Putative transmembrane protein n=1 Tax=Marinomonas primoryensis TaxID=178399 RepID=A0A859CU52_9GAMM|nr:toxin VasX [Marinomonas primoryensis]QKK79848.1 putative transmembrane protein [Marinomonas primoryensis]